MNIAIVDIVFCVIIVVFSLRCAVKGFVSELMSMAALILGLLVAIFFFRSGAFFIREHFFPGMPFLPELIAFILIFLVVFAAIKLLEFLFKRVIDGIQLGGADHFLGFLFGIAQGLVVICLLLFFIIIQPFVDPEIILKGSFFAELLMGLIIGYRQETIDGIRGVTGV